MPLLGAHMSVAGGFHHAVTAAAGFGMTSCQIFTKNANQWKARKPVGEDEAEAFRQALEETGLRLPSAHASYLINLASAKDDLWLKSMDALVDELQRAEALGLRGVVFHPGSYVETSEAAGLERIVHGLSQVHQRTEGLSVRTWLENTAGQGTNLGYKFEHLQYIMEHVEQSERVGVCLDSCHTFAAGYPIQTESDYQETMRQFDDLIGLNRVEAWHLNDSQKPFGSRKDRHEHIGRGEMGREPFVFILNDPRFAELPMYLETEKGEADDGREWDAVNMETLRGCFQE